MPELVHNLASALALRALMMGVDGIRTHGNTVHSLINMQWFRSKMIKVMYLDTN